MRYIYVAVFVSLLLTGVVSAQSSDTFPISQQIIGDIVPPTTPDPLSAVPVASTQIDLSWGASTDDEQLGGYVVYRDSLQIATTTLTTYSDSGLNASTTYTYFVRAFDISYNYSSSSNIVATTTLETSVVVPSDSDSGADISVDLVQLRIDPHVYSADMSWKTDRYARFELRWGRSSSYELGFVINETYKKEHTTTIAGLEPGTRYAFELIAYNRDGQRFVLEEGYFTTRDLPDLVPPTNIANFKGTINGDDIELSWENPADPDFSHVRILRSHLFYPTDPYDGFIVYQGDSEVRTDDRASLQKRILYYTAFAYDTNGNVSSGASIVVYPEGRDVPEGSSQAIDGPLRFEDFQIIQQGAVIQNGELQPGIPFMIRIAYEKLPQHLKTITAQFLHPDNEQSSLYLLRINKDSTFYEAVIPGFIEKGTYPTTIALYDHEIKEAQILRGELYVRTDMEIAPGIGLGPIIGTIDQGLFLDLWFFVVCFLLLFIIFELIRVFTKNDRSVHNPVFRVLQVVMLFLLGAVLSYVLLSITNAHPLRGLEAQVATSFIDDAPLLFGYTLLCALGLLVVVAVRAFFTRT